MESLKGFWNFITGSIVVVSRGNRSYYTWLAFLAAVIFVAVIAYIHQLQTGLILTNMRDQISWGFYIGNFAFLVGVAAAAVVLVIPAYVYEWGPIKEVVLLGELTAVAAIVMCILFVTIDVGRPDRLWHLAPGIGTPNFPYSLLVWDILVLNAYLVVNYFVVTYLLYHSYQGKPYSKRFIMPIIFLSIPLAICIHTVTAFLFMGLVSRPFWNTAILAPRFISSAFASGPALLLLIFVTLRRFENFPISNIALFKIGELLAYSMAVNLFFTASEVYTDFYFQSQHSIHASFQWFGTEGRVDIALYTWTALAFNLTAFVIFVMPRLRRKIGILCFGCVLAALGIFTEKGLGLILPGMTPDVLGEVYAYNPSLTEITIGAGVWAVGALLLTLMARVAMSISLGEFRAQQT